MNRKVHRRVHKNLLHADEQEILCVVQLGFGMGWSSHDREWLLPLSAVLFPKYLLCACSVQSVRMLLLCPNGDNTPVLVPARDSD
jgi:hypothetical protein